MFQPYLAEYRYYALFRDGRGMPDIRNAENLYRSVAGYDMERYEGHGRWKSSRDLFGMEERDSDDQYREATPAEVEQFTRRADAERPAAPREKHGHDPSAPPTLHDPDRQAGVLALLAARRRAEPVDGHYYFAEFESLDDVVHVDRAHALIRCPADGDGDWETFLHGGTWVPGREPRRKHVLPVGREDLERIRRGREAAEVRYFDVWRGQAVEDGHYRHDLVRRTGQADEVVDDLGWQPTDVLGRLEPGWWVLELSERGFRGSRYSAVMMGRMRSFRDQAHDYRAVVRTQDDIYDLDNALFLAKRLPNPYEIEYELWTSDGWRPTHRMLLEFTAVPISEEEFRRLAAHHPGEPA